MTDFTAEASHTILNGFWWIINEDTHIPFAGNFFFLAAFEKDGNKIHTKIALVKHDYLPDASVPVDQLVISFLSLPYS